MQHRSFICSLCLVLPWLYCGSSSSLATFLCVQPSSCGGFGVDGADLHEMYGKRPSCNCSPFLSAVNHKRTCLSVTVSLTTRSWSTIGWEYNIGGSFAWPLAVAAGLDLLPICRVAPMVSNITLKYFAFQYKYVDHPLERIGSL